MTPSSSRRSGARAVTHPTLTTSVDLPRSPDGGYAAHRVSVSVRLPEKPSPGDLRIAEQRIRHLHSATGVTWRRWEWAAVGENGAPPAMVVTVRGAAIGNGGGAIRDTLVWLRSLHRGEPAIRVISGLDVVPVHRAHALPPDVADGDWELGPTGEWVARTAGKGQSRVVLVRRE
jgi:hypothetical protein